MRAGATISQDGPKRGAGDPRPRLRPTPFESPRLGFFSPRPQRLPERGAPIVIAWRGGVVRARAEAVCRSLAVLFFSAQPAARVSTACWRYGTREAASRMCQVVCFSVHSQLHAFPRRPEFRVSSTPAPFGAATLRQLETAKRRPGPGLGTRTGSGRFELLGMTRMLGRAARGGRRSRWRPVAAQTRSRPS